MAESSIENGSNIYLIFLGDRFDEDIGYIKPIEMIFKINQKNTSKECGNANINIDLVNIAKVCFLKEITSRLNDENIQKFPENISIILKLLKNGKIDNIDNMKNESKELLEKIRQTNLLNLSNFIDKLIDPPIIKIMLSYLDKDDFLEVNDLKN